MIKIEIKTLWETILFTHKSKNNTIKETVEKAVKDGAYLSGADLSGADLRGAYLSGAKNIPFIPFACPSDGAFFGWKKVKNCLVKLEIPEDAKRCSATTSKCRCDKAKVLDIFHLERQKSVDSVTNDNYNPSVTYKVGEMVYPDSFDEDRWNECSNGIHFFINKQEAIDY